MPLVQDRSLYLLASWPARYHCTTDVSSERSNRYVHFESQHSHKPATNRFSKENCLNRISIYISITRYRRILKFSYKIDSVSLGLTFIFKKKSLNHF